MHTTEVLIIHDMPLINALTTKIRNSKERLNKDIIGRYLVRAPCYYAHLIFTGDAPLR